MWDYLKRVCNQDNLARTFQLEYEIANYSKGIYRVSNIISDHSLATIQAVH